ncbi:hypothetical protein M9H77_25223 [Catharanthus roseus]|uniref:Uncharacterized protein n=1 Tax=Catharanthus roseus TaxID=4058 RepID=A0ACC0A7R5_CATRO|nr:hypothetical protein M9H77_25223 [Catharanthus roseus]
MQAILHPEQDRVLTVRECARLQGFPDFYRFCGTVKERYCQIGNAVAIPVGKALGYALGMAFQNLVGDEPLITLPMYGRTRTGLWHQRSQRKSKDEQRQRLQQELWRPWSESSPATAGWAVAASVHRTGGSASSFSDYGIHHDSPDPISPEIRGGSPSLLMSLKTHLQEEPASQMPLFITVYSDNKLNYDFGDIPEAQLAVTSSTETRSRPANLTGIDQPTGSPGPRQDSPVQSTAIVQNDHPSRHNKAQQIEAQQTIPSPLAGLYALGPPQSHAEDQHMAASGPSHPSKGPLQLELGPREEWARPHGSQLGKSLGSTIGQQETSSQPETVTIKGNLGLTHSDSSSSNHNYSSDSSDVGQQNVVEPVNLRQIQLKVVGIY